MTLSLDQYVWIQMGLSAALALVALSPRVRASLFYYIGGWALLGPLVRQNAVAVFSSAGWSGSGLALSLRFILATFLVIPFAVLSIFFFVHALAWLGSGAPRRKTSDDFFARIDTLVSAGNLIEAATLLRERLASFPADARSRRELVRLSEMLEDWPKVAANLKILADDEDDPALSLSLSVRVIDVLSRRLKDRSAASVLAADVLSKFRDTPLEERARDLLKRRGLLSDEGGRASP
ncbi:MAG: hypothetical protein V2A58_08580 [Planctomycetota bacterium]